MQSDFNIIRIIIHCFLGKRRNSELKSNAFSDCQALGVPNFSCEAAFLLDAMTALPRKWVSDGAPPLPWIRGSAIRNLGGFIVLA
jgi:hypothetical protein